MKFALPHPSPSRPAQIGLRIDSVGKRFKTATALDDVSMDISAGSFTVLLGPSGCGKSTLLRLIAGLDTPTDGSIHLSGEDITHRLPAQRNLSMVFQSYALFPHLSVAENIIFGLRVRREAASERHARLDRVARMMGLENLLERKPGELSGGQQQRVALARAVISERPVCLMDEPLSNLDSKLRAEMRLEIRALQQRLGLTMIYVTHDQVEAMTMADTIVVMNAGRVEQIATPRELYAVPETVFCARFIGTPPMNLIAAADLPGFEDQPQGTLIGIRPEEIAVAAAGPEVAVEGIEYLGADQLIAARIGASRIILRQPARLGPPAPTLRLSWPTEAIHVFGSDGRRLSSPVHSHSIKETV